MPPSTSSAHNGHRGGRDAPPRIAVAPDSAPQWMTDAVVAGGGHVVPIDQAEGLVWGSLRDPDALEQVIIEADHLRWVQLPFAGIEQYIHLVDDERQWTCAKGVYAEPVAELALTLALAGMRGLGTYARSQSWGQPTGSNLLGANVTILGGGGITESLIRLLDPFDCRVTVVRNRVRHMEGVDEVVEADRYIDALAGADLVVVALALTADTDGMLSRGEFETMEPHAWIVNVARGRHIVTDDLVWALQNGVIGGAALDVTDPEPLPDGHPLWTMPNCIITPHVANTPEMGMPLLAERITANVRRFAADDELLGPVHLELGY
ncbi:MAG: D-3-phosphoglycerate dehydrogenase [Ilumatobacteraceae bacterium]|nr:D-3-phosphoglycerate dehydrogenase [Ilumatobacteraceae bacterium]